MPQAPVDKRLILKLHLQHQKQLHIAPDTVTTADTYTSLSVEKMCGFSQKACAVYITTGLNLEQLLWGFNYFSKRFDIKAALAADQLAAAVNEAFPCKFLACWSPASPHGMAEIQQAHQRICSQMEAPRHAEFQSHPLFRAVLIIMDRLDGYQQQGEEEQLDIQLVRTGDDAHLRSGPIDLDPLRFAFWVSDDGNTLRGRFENVMALVMEWRRREDDARREEEEEEEEEEEDLETENEF